MPKKGQVKAGDAIVVGVSVNNKNLLSNAPTNLASLCVGDELAVSINATDMDEYICENPNFVTNIIAKISSTNLVEVKIECAGATYTFPVKHGGSMSGKTNILSSWLGHFANLSLQGIIEDEPCEFHTEAKDTTVDMSQYSATFAVPKVERIEYKWGEMKWTATSPQITSQSARMCSSVPCHVLMLLGRMASRCGRA